VRVQTASELPDDIAALKAQVIDLQEDLKRSEARSVAYAAALRWAAAADQARHMEEQAPEQLRKEAARLRRQSAARLAPRRRRRHRRWAPSQTSTSLRDRLQRTPCHRGPRHAA